MKAEKRFQNGEIIFKEGDIGTSFFQIIEGTVEVISGYGSDKERSLTELSAGDFFGEMAVIEAYPRSNTVVAKDNALVVEIPENELNSYFAENPGMILKIMNHLGKRIKELTADYDAVASALKEVRASQDKKSDSIFAKIKKYIDDISSSKIDLTKPSAEALRQASESVKGKESGAVESYKKGTVIFKEGEIGKCMYIVYGGDVGIYSNYGAANQIKLTDLYPVACFGEMGMIAGDPRSATAVAETDETFVEIINPEDLEELFRTTPVKVEMILKHLSYRLRMLTYDYLTACKEINELFNS